jgi:hypothetical protein
VEIEIIKLTIEVDNKLSISDAGKLRGFFGHLFWDNPYAHQHQPDGSFVYHYPCIQYKVIEGDCFLIGFKEGIEIVRKTFHELKCLNINGRWEEILAKGLESYKASFSLVTNHVTYSFLTPWLALNEKNYEKYQKFGMWSKRKELLENILVGNLLSMSKSLGYTVTEPIREEIKNFKEVRTKLKDVPMIGFLGTFSVNFEIPDYWGIGKSVSRGFGTVKKVGQ